MSHTLEFFYTLLTSQHWELIEDVLDFFIIPSVELCFFLKTTEIKNCIMNFIIYWNILQNGKSCIETRAKDMLKIAQELSPLVMDYEFYANCVFTTKMIFLFFWQESVSMFYAWQNKEPGSWNPTEMIFHSVKNLVKCLFWVGSEAHISICEHICNKMSTQKKFTMEKGSRIRIQIYPRTYKDEK